MDFHSFENFNTSVIMLSLYTSFPIFHMINNDHSRPFCAMLSTYGFDEIAFWVCSTVSHITILSETRPTHQIKIYTMIHQIIHPRPYSLWRAEINPIFLTHVLNLFPRSRQAHKTWMKLRQIMLQNSRCVSSGVTSDKEGKKRGFA